MTSVYGLRTGRWLVGRAVSWFGELLEALDVRQKDTGITSLS